MTQPTLYDPKLDPDYAAPYIDLEEQRTTPVPHTYLHGGFSGTTVRFALYFPDKAAYTKRFFHKVTPVQGDENASQYADGGQDIAFAITAGAYFVESNMGGMSQDPSLIWKASAQTAEYARTIAAKRFGAHRPHGYIYGGSGGSFKTMGCISNTIGVWDGAVPFVSGAPFSMPNNFTIRVLAKRVLDKKLPQIIDAFEPGSLRDPEEGLTQEERGILREFLQMGFPPKTLYALDLIGPGALPVLTPAVFMMDTTYYTDFWTLPGYEGSNPEGTAARDRMQFKTQISALSLPSTQDKPEHQAHSGVDDAWKSMQLHLGDRDTIALATSPAPGTYLGEGAVLVVETGHAAGKTIPISQLHDSVVTVGTSLNADDLLATLRLLAVGDAVRIDNSDYLALQYYHRHQLPPVSEGYHPWNALFRDEEGEPLHPQRQLPFPVGLFLTLNGGGVLDPGIFNCPVVIVGCLMDESAVPWQQDWYKRKTAEKLQTRMPDLFRLWYVENAMHGDSEHQYDATHVVPYMPVVFQALLDVSDWVERQVPPPADTVYEVVRGQVRIPETAIERHGIQPTLHFDVNGTLRAEVKPGEAFTLSAEVELPEGVGQLLEASFDLDSSGTFVTPGTLVHANKTHTRASVCLTHAYAEPGTYFPVLRVTAGREGDATSLWARPQNLGRVRVVVG